MWHAERHGRLVPSRSNSACVFASISRRRESSNSRSSGSGRPPALTIGPQIALLLGLPNESPIADNDEAVPNADAEWGPACHAGLPAEGDEPMWHGLLCRQCTGSESVGLKRAYAECRR